MPAYACGYLGQHSDLISSFRVLPDSEAQTSLIPGGWGCVALISHGLLHIHAAQARPVVLNLPEGLATVAALGWGTVAALSEPGGQTGLQAGGNLYECRLTSMQIPDSSSQEICQQAQNVPVTWCRLQLLRPVTAVALGEYHSTALTDDGSVWTWGSNTDSQLGWPSQACDQGSSPQPQIRAVAGPQASCSESTEAEQTPTRLGGVQQVMTTIACGARHTCCVGCMGQVFCWGWSLHGQCGQGRAVVSVPQPQAVQALGGLKVVGVAAGLAHTVACTDSGDVYSWGWNADGQLGLGDDCSRAEPELVSDAALEDEHIEQDLGRSRAGHGCVSQTMTSSNSCGNVQFVHRGTLSYTSKNPVLQTLHMQNKQVSCGARHTLVRSKTGLAYAWGWNKYGQLGVGSCTSKALPQAVQGGHAVVDVACGWWHSMLLVRTAGQEAKAH